MTALLDHQESEASAETYRDPPRRVPEHEQRYWFRAFRAAELPHTRPRLLQAVITAVTGCAASNRDEAIDLMGWLPDLHGEHRRVLGHYADWAHQLYPGENWLDPLTPDLLGERLVADTLTAQPELAAALGRAASTPDQHLQLSTILGRAIVQHKAVRSAIPRILTAGADTLWLAAVTVVPYLPRPDIMSGLLADLISGVSDPDVLWAAVQPCPTRTAPAIPKSP